MIISKTQVQNLLKIYKKDTGKQLDKVQAGKPATKEDKLAISGESRIKQRCMQAVKQSEDIRLEKVNKLKEQVSSGTYEVTADEVAEKMIERAIVDRLV